MTNIMIDHLEEALREKIEAILDDTGEDLIGDAGLEKCLSRIMAEVSPSLRAQIAGEGLVCVPMEAINIALSLIHEVEADEDMSAVCYYARTLKPMLPAPPAPAETGGLDQGGGDE